MKVSGTFFIFISFFSILLSDSFAQNIFRGINVGCPFSITDSLENVYVADREYTHTNGYGYTGTNMSVIFPDRLIGGAAGFDSLYFGRREGSFSYLFDLPGDTFLVTLHFAEKTYHWNGFRNIVINIEGETMVPELDLYQKTGRSYSWVVRLLTTCTDGQLNVDLTSSDPEATLSAIAVWDVSEDNIPPPQIAGFEIIDGYEMNILYWDWSNEQDLAGYNVYRRTGSGTWTLQNDDILPQYRYIDKNVTVNTEYEYYVTAVDVWGNESIPSDSLSAVPMSNEDTQLPMYQMEISEENLIILNTNVWSEEYVNMNLTLEGTYFPDAWGRYRGSSVRESDKKNYKLKLPSGELYNCRYKFNLQSGSNDGSMLIERLGYRCFDLLNLLSSQTTNIFFERNGEFIGVYLDVEQVDNYFLEGNGLSTGGNLYKSLSPLNLLPSYTQYQQAFIKENNEESDWYDIIDFVEWINYSTAEEFRDEAGDWYYVDDYIDMYTVLIASADYDFADNNFYLYRNPVDWKWIIIPWDHNEGFSDSRAAINLGTFSAQIYDKYNYLVDKLMEDSLYRYVYCKKLERFLENEFSVPNALDWAEEQQQEIYFDAIRDVYKKGWENPEMFVNGIEVISEFIEVRVPFLLNQIPGYITDPDLSPYFRLNEIQTDNRTTIIDEAGDHDPWLEIYNLSPVELDMENFTLHYGQNSWVFPEEAVIEKEGFLIVWLDGETNEGPLHTDFTVNPGIGNLILEERHGNFIDSSAILNLNPDQVYGRDIDGTGAWMNDLLPTPSSTNTPLPDPSPLVINEFMALNGSTISDSAGDYDDWLEIYNPADYSIPLGGLYLSDNFDRPNKWAFPQCEIGPNGFLLVWCDDEAFEGALHSTFKLSGGGEEIGLYSRDGVTLIDSITFGDQSEDISFGRFPDGSENWMPLTAPTPGYQNSPLKSDEGHFNESIPLEYELKDNFPNPFNPETSIVFALPTASPVKLKIYDILGQEVYSFENKKMEAGYHNFVFNGESLSSGIYFYRIEAGNFVSTKKMLLLK